MKFKELRNKIADIYIDLRFPPCGMVNEFNTRSEAYDEFDVQFIETGERIIVYLNKGENQ